MLKGDACPKDAACLLPPEAATYLRHFQFHIERPPELIPTDVVLPKPYWDPVLAADPAKRHLLFRYLLQLHIIGAHRQSKADAALFFLHKKGRNIRMVHDARCANLIQRRPPKVYFGSPGAIAELDHSEALSSS